MGEPDAGRVAEEVAARVVNRPQGFALLDVDLRGVSNEQIVAELDSYLDEHPRSSANALLTSVQGADRRIGAALSEGVARRAVDARRPRHRSVDRSFAAAYSS